MADGRSLRPVALTLGRFSSSLNGNQLFGLLEFLPGLFQEVEDDSCLVIAADLFANACTNLPNQDNLSISQKTTSIQLYQRTLKAINAALRHPTQSLEDATLTAIWLISNYEVRTARQELCSMSPF